MELKEINDFVELLKTTTSPCTSLYDNETIEKSICFNDLRMKDVISGVTTSIKAIQSADVIKTKRGNQNAMKISSGFVPLSSVKLVNKDNKAVNTNKFETQGITDTQLINLVQNAELIYETHKGITQELEMSFSDIENTTKVEKHTNEEFKNKLINDQKCNVVKIIDNVDADNDDMLMIRVNDNAIDSDVVIDKLKEAEEDNLCRDELERSTSPILIVNVKLKPKAVTPLTFSLETFENFEKVAMPQVSQDVKCTLVIENGFADSTAVNNELCEVNVDNQIDDDDDENLLQSIEAISKTLLDNDVQKATETSKDLDNVSIQTKLNRSYSEDPLLFSSDEDEFLNKDSKESPLTCPLEKSFSDEYLTLDDSVFVGFITANNTSIQVSKESYLKAKDILDEDMNKVQTFSITELVKLNESQNNISTALQMQHGRGVTESSDTNQLIADRSSSDIQNPVDLEEQVSNSSLKDVCTNNNSVSNCKQTEQKRASESIKDMVLLVEEGNKMKSVHKDITDECNQIQDISFPGFKTASNKNINISEQALVKIKNVFLDLDKETISGSKSVPEFQGFKTASNKEVKISDQALVKTKILFQDLESDIMSDNIFMKSVPEFQRFKTASNKEVKISNQALTKSKHIFEELDDKIMCEIDETKLIQEYQSIASNNNITLIDKDVESKHVKQDFNNKMLTRMNEVKPVQKFQCLKTASNKEIKISEQAPGKTKHLFQELVNDLPEINEFQLAHEFQCFKTASNKEVKISEQALGKTKHLFQDLINDLPEINELKSAHEFQGFKTASNKEVKISEQVLGKTKDLFQDLVNDLPEINELKSAHEFQGFKTASNKEVKISEQALGKTKHLFQDLVKDLPEINESKSAHEFEGFKTASNKEVKISEQALGKTKHLFQDLVKDLPEINESKSAHEFEGFKTASNKQVKTSEQALAKTKYLFRELSSDMHEIDETKSVQEFQGFKTASKKQVKVSEQALAKTKYLFQELSSDKPEIDEMNSIQQYQGLKTARGNDFGISNEAFLKSKHLLQDLNEKLESDDNELSLKETFQGFKTGNNKQVIISEQALAKTRRLFLDLNNDFTPLNDDLKSIQNFKGFKTANNKDVKVSIEALAKTKHLFENISDFTHYTNEVKIQDKRRENNDRVMSQYEISGSPEFKAFQTASNDKVEISNETLAKTNHLFQGFNDNVSDTNEFTSFHGFKTASNKEVEVSEKALAKIRHLLQDLGTDVAKDGIELEPLKNVNKEATKKSKIENKTNITNERDFYVYNTDETEITAPEKLLASSKTILLGRNNLIGSTVPNTEFAFATASNKKVNVPQEALAKTKMLFKNIEHNDKGINTYQKYGDNKESKKKEIKVCELKYDADMYLDTQLCEEFLQPMTENCEDEPSRHKRAASPILSCSFSKKKRIFRTPYNTAKITKKVEDIINKRNPEIASYKFDHNYKKVQSVKLKDLKLMENKKVRIDTQNVYEFDDLLNMQFEGKRNNISGKVTTMVDLIDLFRNSVDKKIIPEGWIENHLKLILWKLLSYEMVFESEVGSFCNCKEVLNQLKYRYDRDLSKVERSALRKIYEKDDTSSRTMVLCVVKIFEDSVCVKSVTNLNSNIELELTDGWYCIRTIPDKFLKKIVYDGKIVVGTKLMTHGAELLNCDQGIAPWEDTSKVRLKICGNSTRRVRWDTRLGFQRNSNILVPLSNIKIDGGRVSKLRLYVTRVYPMLFVERFEDGSTVTRTQRQEEIHHLKHENERQLQLEKITEEVEKELELQGSEDSDDIIVDRAKRKSLESGSQIAKAMKHSIDSQEFRATLISEQMRLLTDYNERKRETLVKNIQKSVQDRIQNCFNLKRRVVSLLKVRIADFSCKGSSVDSTSGMLSIWNAPYGLLELVKEDTWIEVANVLPTSLRNNEINISAGRQSMFNICKRKENCDMIPYMEKFKRNCTPIRDLIWNPNAKSNFNEVDTVGIVFLIDPTTEIFENGDGHNLNFQNVYLTDENRNFICINFWGGLNKCGFQKFLELGDTVACLNLQKRIGNTRKTIPQFRATESTNFVKSPKGSALKDHIADMHEKLKGINVNTFCQECVNLKNKMSNSCSVYKSNEYFSPYRSNLDKSNYNLSKHKIFIDSPLGSKALPSKHDFDLTGAFDCSLKERNALSPQETMRKQRIYERIEKLKRYGEPPPLSPITIINRSENARNQYKSPLVTNDISSVANTENSVSVANVENNNKLDVTSPILNRNYIKRSIGNPVRLNFCNLGDEESPPMSLD